MQRLQNLKIGTRLWILVLVAIVMMVLSGAISSLSLSKVAQSAGNTYESVVLPNNYLQQVTNTYATVRVLVRDFPMGMVMDDQAYIDDDIKTLQGAQASMIEILTQYRAHVVNAKMSEESIAELDSLIAAFNNVNTVVDSIIADVKTGNINLVNANILENFDKRNVAMREAINALADRNFALAESNNNHIAEVQSSTIVIGVVSIILSVGVVFTLAYVIMKSITGPIQMITEATQKLAVGNVDVHVESNAKDELGILARAFSSMAQNFYGQSKVLSKMAKGDFTGYSEIRGDEDIVNHAIQDMLDNNNRLLSMINEAANQLTSSVGYITVGAQSLATGSAQQAATIQQLSDSMAQVHKQAEVNSGLADSTASEVVQAGQLMEKNLDYMTEMTQAMRDIEKESDAISQVIKMIDDIAFQTNILALNAAVEAARAGQHGKGFAVVADEVRNLASKSAAAAHDTALLIERNVANVKRGSDIAAKTESSLRKAGEIMDGNVQSMNLIKTGSMEQTAAINNVDANIGQISMVVQANSATAQESAASAEELSAQSTLLSKTVNQFKLRSTQANESRQVTGMSL